MVTIITLKSCIRRLLIESLKISSLFILFIEILKNQVSKCMKCNGEIFHVKT